MSRKKAPLTSRQAIEAELREIQKTEDRGERDIQREAAKLDRQYLAAQLAFGRAKRSHDRAANILVRRKVKLNDSSLRRRAVLEARLAAL